MLTQVAVDDPPDSGTAPGWGPIHRLAFRFFSVYALLYFGLSWLFFLPFTSALGAALDGAHDAIAVWMGVHVLHLSQPLDLPPPVTGSGDTLLAYLALLADGAIAAAAAAAWSIADRRRHGYPILHEWLRVYLRYTIALIMLGYGMAKVFPGQFGRPTLDRLLEPYGHSSPMGLLWTFMGYSRPYDIFCGAVEVAGGVLLFWQRTTTLGALLLVLGMGNVVMLNFAYDVPVKLYSSHIVLAAAVLVLPDLRRLARVFLLNRAADPAPLRPPFATPLRRRLAVALKVVVVVMAIWQRTAPQVRALGTAPKPARYGIYEVQTFTANGTLRPAVPMDATRWRRVIVNEFGSLTIQTMDDAMVRYRARDDAAAHRYELSTNFNPSEKVRLTYSQPSPDELLLEGDYAGEAIAARMRRVPPPSFLLVTRGFHWINEYPYNR
jgi:hypothetical protein